MFVILNESVNSKFNSLVVWYLTVSYECHCLNYCAFRLNGLLKIVAGRATATRHRQLFPVINVGKLFSRIKYILYFGVHWCHCHPIISGFIKIQIGLTFVVSAYPCCPGNEAVKRVCLSVCLFCTKITQYKYSEYSKCMQNTFIESVLITNTKHLKVFIHFNEILPSTDCYRWRRGRVGPEPVIVDNTPASRRPAVLWMDQPRSDARVRKRSTMMFILFRFETSKKPKLKGV